MWKSNTKYCKRKFKNNINSTVSGFKLCDGILLGVYAESSTGEKVHECCR